MSPDLEFASKEKQEARAALRKSFLQQLTALQGQHCKITTHENSQLVGQFSGFDVDIQELLISNLQTPTSVIPAAILRSSDVIVLDFSKDLAESENVTQ